jgi:hypothetical protein
MTRLEEVKVRKRSASHPSAMRKDEDQLLDAVVGAARAECVRMDASIDAMNATDTLWAELTNEELSTLVSGTLGRLPLRLAHERGEARAEQRGHTGPLGAGGVLRRQPGADGWRRRVQTVLAAAIVNAATLSALLLWPINEAPPFIERPGVEQRVVEQRVVEQRVVERPVANTPILRPSSAENFPIAVDGQGAGLKRDRSTTGPSAAMVAPRPNDSPSFDQAARLEQLARLAQAARLEQAAKLERAIEMALARGLAEAHPEVIRLRGEAARMRAEARRILDATGVEPRR